MVKMGFIYGLWGLWGLFMVYGVVWLKLFIVSMAKTRFGCVQLYFKNSVHTIVK